MYAPYADAVGMLLHINGKFTMGKVKSSILSLSFVLSRPSLSISRVCQDMKQTYLYLWYVSAEIRITVCGKKYPMGLIMIAQMGYGHLMSEGEP